MPTVEGLHRRPGKMQWALVVAAVVLCTGCAPHQRALRENTNQAQASRVAVERDPCDEALRVEDRQSGFFIEKATCSAGGLSIPAQLVVPLLAPERTSQGSTGGRG